MDNGENTLISHLEALRSTFLRCFYVTCLVYPFAYWASGALIDLMVDWSFGNATGQLHYFGLMEVVLIRLKMALVLSLVAAYPWNLWQVWGFVKPALYENERKALCVWTLFASLLFFMGVAFCALTIMPLLVGFSQSFASESLKPILNLGDFVSLAGWLSFAFGIMFQTPIVVMLAVKFGLISSKSIRKKRPYVIVTILILAAVLTPPDVISQLLLAVPTWLLFELGLLLASRLDKNLDKKEM